MKTILHIILLFFFIINSWSQNLKRIVAEKIELEKRGKNQEGIYSFNNEIKKNPDLLFTELIPYLNDSNSSVRYFTLNIIQQIGQSNSDLTLKNKIIEKLIFSLRDQESYIINASCSYLTKFSKNDFTKNQKDSISSFIRNNNIFNKNLIRLTGYLELYDLLSFYKEKIHQKEIRNPSITFNILLAMSRMGDVETNYTLLNFARSKELNDDLVYDLIPDFIYTRQKEIYDYLIDLLNSNDKNCYSANPSQKEKIICAYRIMEYLAQVIENIPLQTSKGGDVIALDYNEALKITRQWFSTNQNSYQIKKDNF